VSLRAGRRAEALTFALVLLGAGYFHQGGGWNQNSRFAMVRSVVEHGSFFIDSHLVYQKRAGAPEGSLERIPVASGNFERDGVAYALAWRSATGALTPVDPAAAGDRKLVGVDDVGATGDVSYFAGHFHPNKAPGTSLLALPGYALVRFAEYMAGLDADSWVVLTWNAWLVSLLSVGLATAFGAVLVLRLARDFGSELSARLAALVFAFATMAWTYATCLFEHNIIAVALVAALYGVERAAAARKQDGAADTERLLHFAGIAAGFAAITNYTMAALVPLFALLWWMRTRETKRIAWYALGVLWPFLVVCGYNVICFGTPFTTNYAYQSTMFSAGDRVLGVFAMPRLDVLALLLVSPFRGLFFTAPVLLCSMAALAVLLGRRDTRPAAGLIAAVFVFLLLVNSSFNGWDGGWTAVPRYLAPAMGLLAIPLAVAFDRWRSITFGLAAVSLTMQFLLVTVDPQVPIGDVGTAGVPVSKVFTIDPVARYVVPLFTSGRAWPLIDEQIEDAVGRSARVATQRGDSRPEIERKAAQLRTQLRDKVARGEGAPLALGGVEGPVSANPIGIYEGFYYRLFPAGSAEARGNSFNLGELVFPQSRLSLLPLLVLAGGLLALLFQNEGGPAPTASATGAPVPGGAVGNGAATTPRRKKR
jgi:hypothetical protein